MAVEDSLDIFGSDPFGRDYLYGLSTGRDGQGLAPYGTRYAESVNQPTTAKGRGYLGNVGTMQEPMTELSASSDFGGRTVRYPLIVPTLTADELNLLRSGGEPTQEIYGKAQQYALGRLSRGQDPFATTQELRYPQPQAVDTRPYDQMQATPRGFTSGLFSDVLGGTLNMPSIPRTGIPALDLLYMNRNPLFNMMGVGDVQKTAERISYGQPLTTGQGMTLRPREEAIFAGMAVAPFVGEAVNLGARAGRAGARMVGERIAENVTMGRPNLPSMFAEPRSSLFAVEPSPSMAAADESSAMRQQLTGKMQALLAQKKVATSAVEVGAINQQISELQAQFKSLPAVGRVAREVVAPQITAPVSDLGFYSAAEQAAMNLERSKGTGQSFLNDLMNAPDVKKDELSWIGLDDFLKDKPNVTKQEVQDFIASNKIDLQEVRLGEPFTEDPVGVSKRLAIFDKYEPEIQALYKEMDNPRYRLVNKGMSAEEYNRGVVLQNRGFRGEPLTAQEQSELDGILKRLDGNTVKEFANAEEARKVYLAMSPEEKLQHSIRPVKSSTELQQEINTLQNIRDIEADKAYVIPEPAPTKHPRWQLAGGENYREILLKMPENMSEYNKYTESLRAKYGQGGFANLPLTDIERARLEKFYANEDVSPYKHSHWGDEPNVLAHIRVNDRVDADGKKMLLVEELQSDWHQAGRETGYNKKLTQAESDELRNLQKKEQDEDGLFQDDIQRINELEKKSMGGVPDAPFKDTWYQLSLKRILKYAADNGYERVGLTTGKQQIDRFSNELRQNVDEITFQTGQKLTPSEAAELQALRSQQTYMTGTERARYEYLSSNEGEYVGKGETKIKAFKGSKPTFSGTVKDGKFIDGQAQGKTVEEVLGKTMAKQIAEKQTGVLKGDNLTVGGEGMKAYYDEIYPKFLEKYGKKWDAGVGETKVRTNEVPYIDYVVTRTPFSDFTVVGVKPDGSKTIINQNANSIEEAQKLATRYKDKNLKSGEPIRYIDITPKMKEGVKKGQPLAAAEQTPEMLASGGLDYADPFKNPLLESTIG